MLVNAPSTVDIVIACTLLKPSVWRRQHMVPTVQDAIDKLNTVDHDFYIYLDDDSGHVQVVYSRKSGDGYGVIITIPDNADIP